MFVVALLCVVLPAVLLTVQRLDAIGLSIDYRATRNYYRGIPANSREAGIPRNMAFVKFPWEFPKFFSFTFRLLTY